MDTYQYHVPKAERLLIQARRLIEPSTSRSDVEALRLDIERVLNAYLEQSTLLDGVLHEFIQLLSEKMLSMDGALSDALGRCLYTASKVRGYKNVKKLFPQGPETLQSLFQYLTTCSHAKAGSSPGWETQYVGLLWASANMLVPFPMQTVVSESDIDSLYQHCLLNLHGPGKVPEAAALLLAELVNRRDCQRLRQDFVKRCRQRNVGSGASVGLTRALVIALKSGNRSDWAECGSSFVSTLPGIPSEASTQAMVLLMKLAQRCALVCLPERSRPWAYERGARVLFGATPKAVEVPSDRDTGNGAEQAKPEFEYDMEQDSLEKSIQTAERTVDLLLQGLENRDTVVRWSAAKGLGRICARLSQQDAEEVVGAILGSFESPAMVRADSSWHGSCLALAEVCRRGLVLPNSAHFQTVVRVTQRAARFDVRRGAHSVGAHVRDAACYVVWAMARAYASSDMEPYAKVIANSMLPVALLDREVNCRRAASAALQECVGRFATGVIPDGIDVIATVDFFALGDRGSSYTQLAPRVAHMANGVYFESILTELWAGKLMHWDPAIRQLAASSLKGFVATTSPCEVSTVVFPRLLQLAIKRGDPIHRHGAVLGLVALAPLVVTHVSASQLSTLRRVPGVLLKKGYLKGQLGDLMHIATCRLINTFTHILPVPCSENEDFQSECEDSLRVLETSLGTGNEELAEIAASAYEGLFGRIVAADPAWCARTSTHVLTGIESAVTVELQRGMALAAGAIAQWVDEAHIAEALVAAACAHPDIETRRNTVVSLSKLTFVQPMVLAERVLPALRECLLNYAIDDRGDVGSWVREAAMQTVATILRGIHSRENHLLAWNDSTWESVDRHSRDCAQEMVRQVCDRIDRTANCGIRALLQIHDVLSRADDSGNQKKGHASGTCDLPMTASVIRESCAPLKRGCHGNPIDGKLRTIARTDLAARLLAVPTVSKSALRGIVAGCGTVPGGSSSSSNERSSLDIVLQHVDDIGDNVERLADFWSFVADTISGEDDRLVVPAMVVAEYVARKGGLSMADENVASKLVVSIRNCWRGRLRDIPRITAALSALCEIAVARKALTSTSRAGSARRGGLEALVVIVGGPVPRLRRLAAEWLNIVLTDAIVSESTWDNDRNVPQTKSDAGTAMELLVDVEWERLSVKDARSKRNELCGILHVQQPVPIKST